MKLSESTAEIRREALVPGFEWLSLLTFRKHSQRLVEWRDVNAASLEDSLLAIEVHGAEYLRLRQP